MGQGRVNSVTGSQAERIIREGHEYLDKVKRGEIKPEEKTPGREETRQTNNTAESQRGIKPFFIDALIG